MTFNIKRLGQSFYILTIFFSVILEDSIAFYLSFVIIYGNLKYIAGTAQILQRKLRIVPN